MMSDQYNTVMLPSIESRIHAACASWWMWTWLRCMGLQIATTSKICPLHRSRPSKEGRLREHTADR